MTRSLARIVLAGILVFGLAGMALAQNQVTFKVNMTVQQQLGKFDPQKNIVVIRGSFENEVMAQAQDWKGNLFQLTEGATAGVYEITINFPDSTVGQTYYYKFVIDDTSMVGDSTTQGGTWESISNRSFTVQGGVQELAEVYFDDRQTVGVTANVTFRADMTDLIAKGWFDPAKDTLRVVGGFNDWSEAKAQVMKPELFNPNILSSTEIITAEPNTVFEFKFRAAPHDRFVDNGWEAGANHKFTFTGQDQTVGPIKPNIQFAGEPLPTDVTVLFQVDVRNATETYHNNLFKNIRSVWIKGDKPELGSWGGSWTYDDTVSVMVRMYDDGTNGDKVAGDGIWSAQVTFPAGTRSAFLYKYGVVADSVDTLNGGVAYLDNEAGFGVNHSAVIPGDNPNFELPVDRFGSQRVLPNAHVFRVDMSVMRQLGKFDPAKNVVVMRGSFENESIPNAEDWKGNEFMLFPQAPQTGVILKPTGNADIYEIAVPFYDTTALNQTYEYKFVIEDTSRYTDHATQAGNWETRSNRTFTAVAGGDTMQVVYFDDRSSVGVTANVTFKADMSDLIAKGWFDPAQDTLRVVGGFNDWSEAKAQVMKPELLNPSILSSTETITAEPNTVFEFKFRAAPHERFLDNGWEAGPNHQFTFTGQDQVVGPIKPNLGYAGTPLAQDVTVQFSVYTVGATETFHNMPFHNIKSVWMKGDKPELGAWAGSWTYDDTVSIMVRLYDDGQTKGDKVAGDGIWTTQVTFPKGTMSAILYKYGIVADGVDTLNGGVAYLDNEAEFANNHSLIIPDDNPFYEAPTDTFGSQRISTHVVERTKPVLPQKFALYQNHPNPFNPVTTIRYDVPKDAHVTIAVYNLLGQKVKTLVDMKLPAGSYTVTWNGRDESGRAMATGMYIYRMEAGNFVAVRKLLLLK